MTSALSLPVTLVRCLTVVAMLVLGGCIAHRPLTGRHPLRDMQLLQVGADGAWLAARCAARSTRSQNERVDVVLQDDASRLLVLGIPYEPPMNSIFVSAHVSERGAESSVLYLVVRTRYGVRGDSERMARATALEDAEELFMKRFTECVGTAR